MEYTNQLGYTLAYLNGMSNRHSVFKSVIKYMISLDDEETQRVCRYRSLRALLNDSMFNRSENNTVLFDSAKVDDNIENLEKVAKEIFNDLRQVYNRQDYWILEVTQPRIRKIVDLINEELPKVLEIYSKKMGVLQFEVIRMFMSDLNPDTVASIYFRPLVWSQEVRNYPFGCFNMVAYKGSKAGLQRTALLYSNDRALSEYCTDYKNMLGIATKQTQESLEFNAYPRLKEMVSIPNLIMVIDSESLNQRYLFALLKILDKYKIRLEVLMYSNNKQIINWGNIRLSNITLKNYVRDLDSATGKIKNFNDMKLIIDISESLYSGGYKPNSASILAVSGDSDILNIEALGDKVNNRIYYILQSREWNKAVSDFMDNNNRSANYLCIDEMLSENEVSSYLKLI